MDSPAAARFCARLLAQSLEHSLPASKRFAWARAALLRPVPFLRRTRPDIDAVLDQLDETGTIRALALHRRSGLTIFVFSEADEPILVAKLPGDAAALERDADALRIAEPAEIAPAFVGRAGSAYLQEALRGFAVPLGADRWLPEQDELAAGLIRLAAKTATDARPDQLADSFAEAEPLSAPARRAVDGAERDLRALRRAVLTHGDLSPHNCLCADGRLTGIVDWEGSKRHGAPGFDLWNHAVAYLEHSLGVETWSQGAVAEAFEGAWAGSGLFRAARAGARACALAAGVADNRLDQLEVAFFARRALVRMKRPGDFPTTAATAARMLEVVCGH